ncbi:MAG TPA: 1,2-phenylacetyl-CoA epoxidase subunit PaaC [Nitrolancea sp.]|nr:1,2-phenylacetyl-CoA epoxidase subunit PaaC [Nitrolancea sp.]
MSREPDAQPQAALRRHLITLADDELVLGYRCSEWTGVAPMVEEDVAFSSLAQDEIGHARLYYTLASELGGGDPDRLALDRAPGDYYHARVLEQRTAPRYDPSGLAPQGGDWARAVALCELYERFDELRTAVLAECSLPQIAGALDKVRREERYHLRHAADWWSRLAGGSPEARDRLQQAIDDLWPGVLGLFEGSPGEALLVEVGVLPGMTAALRPRWLEALAPAFAAYGLTLPSAETAPLLGGRQGIHGPEWDALHDEMTMVRRLAPEGVW